MPVNPTFPGVYIEEVPSGVRTITAVSTSVTAFIGAAKRGPVDKATHILGFSEYERRFGGLDAGSEMSYAVRQFFANGGADAWVVRVAKNAGAALRTLQNGDGNDVLEITALDKGASGNFIEVRVDFQTARPTSNFNLSLNYVNPDTPTDRRSEVFQNLSMNSADVRYVEDALKSSELVSARRVAALGGLGSGTSKSGELVDGGGNPLDIASLLDGTHNTLQVAVNGLPPVKVVIALPADLSGGGDALTNLCAAIQAKVQAAAGGKAALSGFICVKSGNALLMTSGEAGEFSTVRVLPGPTSDCSGRLKLAAEETDAVGAIRPKETPDPGTLTGGTLSAGDMNSFPDATHTSFLIALDGGRPEEVFVGATAFTGGTAAVKIGLAAAAIQAAVRALKPLPAFTKFSCTVSSNKLVLASGTRGDGSSVAVLPAPANSIADEFHLLAGSSSALGVNLTLQSGTESAFTEDEAYPLIIGSQAKREGLYALDLVQTFNLLCLPGFSDPGILADAAAYVASRRAFLIVDPPADTDTPAEMLTKIGGSDFPKSKDAAVYFPWVKIGDPLKGGKLRLTAPSGTVAGLYARTDTQRGVWKAPAGTEATLAGVQAMAYTLTDLENGTLNPEGVNCLRSLPVFGTVAWGARTLRGADQMADEYKYVPVRRTALFIEESLFRGVQWVVFEPNDEPLWAQIRLNVGSFLHGLFRRGAFAGQTPAEAYFVRCDHTTTTQDDVNRGVVNILVGFAPLKPAEFVIIQIQQMAGQLQA